MYNSLIEFESDKPGYSKSKSWEDGDKVIGELDGGRRQKFKAKCEGTETDRKLEIDVRNPTGREILQ